MGFTICQALLNQFSFEVPGLLIVCLRVPLRQKCSSSFIDTFFENHFSALNLPAWGAGVFQGQQLFLCPRLTSR